MKITIDWTPQSPIFRLRIEKQQASNQSFPTLLRFKNTLRTYLKNLNMMINNTISTFMAYIYQHC